MYRVTKEQINAAKQMTAIEFLWKYRPGELVKTKSREEYELREHDSFKINERTSFWHWKSRDIGGRTALDYLIKVENMKFVEAVEFLCQELPVYVPPAAQPEKKRQFVLPPAAKNDRRVFAYLMKRGISREAVLFCLRAGILYESEGYHNAVFVGRDQSGTARYAFLRGTYTKSAEPFRMEVPGSDKRFCFFLPPKEDSKKLAVYESAIDALAHLTLEGTADKYRLSLGGIYAPKEGTEKRAGKPPAALEAFLERHPEIEELELCMDNDYAGRWAARKIMETYQKQYMVSVRLPEREGCDYGDLAKEANKAALKRADYSR